MPVGEKSSFSRVWTLQYRASPSHVPIYQGYSKAGAIEQGLGDVTPIRVPSKESYGQFTELAITRGAEDRPTTSLIFKYLTGRSDIEKMAKSKCALDVQIHFGRCSSPTSFNQGWEKIVIFENAVFTNYATSDIGAFDQSEEAVIEETVDLSGEWFYEVVPIRLVERAQSEVGQEVIAVGVIDSEGCGDCATPSDGCQRVFAVSAPGTASPGVLAEVLFTADGGVTWGDSWITSLAVGEDPTDAVGVGDYLVVVSNDSNSLHYANWEDVLNGAETWSEVTTGFVVTGEPNAIASAGAADTWIVGDGGYVYYSESIVDGVEVLDAGAATTEDLNDVDAYDAENVVAVGNANTVLYSTDGETFSAVTGPDTVNTPNLLSVLMLDERTWIVGTADNAAWYTENSGTGWTQMRFPGDTTGGGGTGEVRAIVAATRNVLYLAHKTSATAGRILRSLDGGHSWYVLPEGSGSIPANDQINALATCWHEANVVFAGGLADNGADGIILKGS